MQEGNRAVRGSVTCATRVVGESWARQQRALLTGDDDGNTIRCRNNWIASLNSCRAGTGW